MIKTREAMARAMRMNQIQVNFDFCSKPSKYSASAKSGSIPSGKSWVCCILVRRSALIFSVNSTLSSSVFDIMTPMFSPFGVSEFF